MFDLNVVRMNKKFYLNYVWSFGGVFLIILKLIMCYCMFCLICLVVLCINLFICNYKVFISFLIC